MDIESYCSHAKKGMDCSEYAMALSYAFPDGEILCLQCENDTIFVANFKGIGCGSEYKCHYVYVYNNKVYDILCNNIGISAEKYISLIKDLNKNKKLIAKVITGVTA